MATIMARYGAILQMLQMNGNKPPGDPDDPSIPWDPPVPVEPEEVTRIETATGFQFDPVYRQFLIEIGGATFFDTWIQPRESPVGDLGPLPFGCIYGREAESNKSIQANLRTYAQRIPKSLFVFGRGGFGDQFCLGVEGVDLGRVYFWEHEGEQNEQDYWAQFGKGNAVPRSWLFANVSLVANSFDEFLRGLRPGLS
jgi:SMI1-KNR4 cell-wall